MEEIDGPSPGGIFKPAAWEKTRTEGAKVLQRLLELPMPVVGVANGPAIIHSEYLLLSDIHIASDLSAPRTAISRTRRSASPVATA
jgi:enoyl-CoA hydratase/carnithine racemase